MKEVILAESAGFCFGVKRSVELAEQMLDGGGACYSLGELIHNDDVVRHFRERGLHVVETPEEVPIGAKAIIRAHGVSMDVEARLRARTGQVVDSTCPMVLRIHKLVREASAEHRKVVVIGTASHPEVVAICGCCENPLVFEDAQALDAYLEKHPEFGENPVTMVIQTTQTRENFEQCEKKLKKECTNLKIFDTICEATSTRQSEAIKLASECDAMVVVGGKHSANSVHLSDLCKAHCGQVQFIENAGELDLDALRDAEKVGMTAGASAPSWIIKEVKQTMTDEIKNEETTAGIAPTEKSFEELLEESFKSIYNGDKVTGEVVAITPTEVNVDLGMKYSGFIPTTEFTEETGAKIEDCIKVGDQIEAVVVRVNDVEGTVQLSKKRLDAAKTWELIVAAAESGEIMEGVVTEDNKGGVVVSVKGNRVFVPASQTGLPREAEMSSMLKEHVRLKITEIKGRRVVGSIRAVQREERRIAAEKVWSEIEVGKHYNGVVKSIASYGVFVDIGGIDGMVHVSELSWGRVRNPADIVSVGQEMDVYVISFDQEARKISLGHKDPNGNPWTKFLETYQVGDVAKVKIVKLMDFGAFAEVLPGVDGLIHISQIADRRIDKPGDVLTVGEEVEAKITAIDEEKQKISLSIRALLEPQRDEYDDED
ncbi:MAG: bifunctional 4-hydroxy-3-methylbut-2-enyl diphosphate reductase/30S ribosomal protein S1 [Oscillospiraceae bacterium]|nr:bifunctional 4-hydroxy-3-methylbut-2-enyl diphosphate reductase/30S ribosomal protein S1 [Oscillospiraceae bacterium]